AQPHTRQHLPIAEQHAIPPHREAAPHGHELRVVERVGDHRKNRDVEECESQHQHGEQEERAVLAHLCAPAPVSCSWNRWKIMIGITSTMSSAIATALAIGQLRLRKNSSHSTRPIISESVPPSRRGITNSPTAGMNTSIEPAMIPGNDRGSVT